jgi:hypothetical protein
MIPYIRAGILIDGVGIRTRGTIGLLVRNADRRVGVLSVATVLPSGFNGLLGNDFSESALSVFAHFALGDPTTNEAISDASALLVSAQVSEDVLVSAALAGIVEAGNAVRPSDVIGVPMQLCGANGVFPVGTIRAYGTSAIIRWPNGMRLTYSDLAEVAMPDGYTTVPGDAGALVTTRTSDPLGLVVGAIPGALLVAPLEAAMDQAKFKSLTTYDAQEHNGRVRDRKPNATITEVNRFAARVESRLNSAAPTSQEMFKNSNVAELVSELECA